jgi:hypothetical protein
VTSIPGKQAGRQQSSCLSSPRAVALAVSTTSYIEGNYRTILDSMFFQWYMFLANKYNLMIGVWLHAHCLASWLPQVLQSKETTHARCVSISRIAMLKDNLIWCSCIFHFIYFTSSHSCVELSTIESVPWWDDNIIGWWHRITFQNSNSPH